MNYEDVRKMRKRRPKRSPPAPPLPPPVPRAEPALFNRVLEEEQTRQQEGKRPRYHRLYDTHEALTQNMDRRGYEINTMTAQLEAYRGKFPTEADEAQFEEQLQLKNDKYEECSIVEQKLLKMLLSEADSPSKVELRRDYPALVRKLEKDEQEEQEKIKLQEMLAAAREEQNKLEKLNKSLCTELLKSDCAKAAEKIIKKTEKSSRKAEKQSKKLKKKSKPKREEVAAKESNVASDESLSDDVFDTANEEPERSAKSRALLQLCYVAEKINKLKKRRERVQKQEKKMKRKAWRKENDSQWLCQRLLNQREEHRLCAKEKNYERLMASLVSKFKRTFVDP